MKRIFLLIVSLCMFSSACMANPVYYYNYSNTSNYVYEPNTDKNYAQSVVDLVNRERLKAGVRPLILNPYLCSRSDIRANELATIFAHTRPDGSQFYTVLDRRKFHYMTAGENAAAGASSPQEVVDIWMNSSGHRQNILNPKFRYIGVGYAYVPNSQYNNYWIQIFSD